MGRPQLKSLMVVISLDGLTLHFRDRAKAPRGVSDRPGATESGSRSRRSATFTTGPTGTDAGAIKGAT